MQEEFQEGDLIWAKMKGFPPWPARIKCRPPPTGRRSQQYYVFFFGTHNYAWIPKKYIQPHTDALVDRYANAKKRSNAFLQAMDKITRISKRKNRKLRKKKILYVSFNKTKKSSKYANNNSKKISNITDQHKTIAVKGKKIAKKDNYITIKGYENIVKSCKVVLKKLKYTEVRSYMKDKSDQKCSSIDSGERHVEDMNKIYNENELSETSGIDKHKIKKVLKTFSLDKTTKRMIQSKPSSAELKKNLKVSNPPKSKFFETAEGEASWTDKKQDSNNNKRKGETINKTYNAKKRKSKEPKSETSALETLNLYLKCPSKYKNDTSKPESVEINGSFQNTIVNGKSSCSNENNLTCNVEKKRKAESNQMENFNSKKKKSIESKMEDCVFEMQNLHSKNSPKYKDDTWKSRSVETSVSFQNVRGNELSHSNGNNQAYNVKRGENEELAEKLNTKEKVTKDSRIKSGTMKTPMLHLKSLSKRESEKKILKETGRKEKSERKESSKEETKSKESEKKYISQEESGGKHVAQEDAKGIEVSKKVSKEKDVLKEGSKREKVSEEESKGTEVSKEEPERRQESNELQNINSKEKNGKRPKNQTNAFEIPKLCSKYISCHESGPSKFKNDRTNVSFQNGRRCEGASCSNENDKTTNVDKIRKEKSKRKEDSNQLKNLNFKKIDKEESKTHNSAFEIKNVSSKYMWSDKSYPSKLESDPTNIFFQDNKRCEAVSYLNENDQTSNVDKKSKEKSVKNLNTGERKNIKSNSEYNALETRNLHPKNASKNENDPTKLESIAINDPEKGSLKNSIESHHSESEAECVNYKSEEPSCILIAATKIKIRKNTKVTPESTNNAKESDKQYSSNEISESIITYINEFSPQNEITDIVENKIENLEDNIPFDNIKMSQAPSDDLTIELKVGNSPNSQVSETTGYGFMNDEFCDEILIADPCISLDQTSSFQISEVQNSLENTKNKTEAPYSNETPQTYNIVTKRGVESIENLNVEKLECKASEFISEDRISGVSNSENASINNGFLNSNTIQTNVSDKEIKRSLINSIGASNPEPEALITQSINEAQILPKNLSLLVCNTSNETSQPIFQSHVQNVTDLCTRNQTETMEEKYDVSLKKIGVIGMGKIGKSIAKHILEGGYSVCIWNRNLSKCQSLVELGAERVLYPEDLVRTSDIILSCVSDDFAAKSIFFEENGVFEGLKSIPKSEISKKGYIENSTLRPQTSREIAKAVIFKGARFLEAPLNGSTRDSMNGELNMFAAGNESLYEECKYLFQTFTKINKYVGNTIGNAAMVNIIQSMAFGTVYASLTETLYYIKNNYIEGMGPELKKIIKDMICNTFVLKDNRSLMSVASTFSDLKNYHQRLDAGMALGGEVCQHMPVTNKANMLYSKWAESC